MQRSFELNFPLQPNTVALLAAVCVAMSALILWYLLVRERADSRRLREHLSSFARTGLWPSRVVFRSSGANSLWQAMRLLGNVRDSSSESHDAFDQALLLGRQLAEASDLESSVASTLTRVLLEQMQPEGKAAAVMLRDRESAELRITHVQGLPLSRIETSLLMCFDSMESYDQEWGYRSASDGYSFDFKTFGLGLSLFVPLRERGELCGGVWIGFQTSASGLTADRMSFIRAMADHAAASFSAAKRAESRSEESEKERDFLLGLSHDIRSPGNRALYAVRDLLETETDSLTKIHRERLSVVEHSIREQLELLGDMVKLSSLRNGILDANPSAVSVYPFLASALASHSAIADSKGLVLRTVCNPNVFAMVDPKQFRRILSNLLSNAIKYTEHGEIELSCEVQDSVVKISICDTGRGVPSALRSSLFDPFSREEKDGSGMGIGLALTKSLAELNKGTLEYAPRQDGGSRFTLSLPYAVHSDSLLSSKLLPEQYPIHCLLIIDDDIGACRSSARVLSTLARVTLPAHSVAEARQILHIHRPDVVVSDFHLLDGTLLDVEDAIEDDALLIVLSGDSSEILKPRLRGRRNTVFFEKPVSADELREVIGGGKRFAKVA